ncbi:thioredoxin [Litorimonas cladophorae]|uniref:Thioredoxin n=1 Tax=Litorimonas cladophorae TaxID=1220491 RepID=A0A918KQT8_9PROT|nr:TlpA disulfide reductase family protein [Litorimonas cladophorae]GGX72274.1 thioredoxin [Litorimonas cladophorae]
MTSSFFSLGNAIRTFFLVGLFGVLFVVVQSCQQPASGLDRYAVGSLKKLTAREAPPVLPTSTFETADGRKMTLADYRGKTVVLNVWATWCPPCIKEMPSLDRLQDMRGGDDFEVITISIDRTKYEPAKFFADNDIQNLVPYHDGSFGIPGNLQLRGYPTTVIYNRDGREIAILEGEAEWDSKEALALMDYLITR